ncbi:MAG: hypothetical protein K1060chlam4_00175 [Candidatus Anoxychlamydiales bacterium]|nr:hypothetical protein [Candidatus Anoxychlamydiales bacterium]
MANPASSASNSINRLNIEDQILGVFNEINNSLDGLSQKANNYSSHRRESLSALQKALFQISTTFAQFNQNNKSSIPPFIAQTTPIEGLNAFDLFQNILKNLPNANVQDKNTIEVIARLRDVISNNFIKPSASEKNKPLCLALKLRQFRNKNYKCKKYSCLTPFLEETYSLISDESKEDVRKNNSSVLFQKLLEKLQDKVTDDQKFIYSTLHSLLNPILVHNGNEDLERLKTLRNEISQYSSLKAHDLTHKEVIDLTREEDEPHFNDLDRAPPTSSSSRQPQENSIRFDIEKIISLIQELKKQMTTYSQVLEANKIAQSDGFAILKLSSIDGIDKKIKNLIKQTQSPQNPVQEHPMRSTPHHQGNRLPPNQVVASTIPFSSPVPDRVFNFESSVEAVFNPIKGLIEKQKNETTIRHLQALFTFKFAVSLTEKLNESHKANAKKLFNYLLNHQSILSLSQEIEKIDKIFITINRTKDFDEELKKKILKTFPRAIPKLIAIDLSKPEKQNTLKSQDKESPIKSNTDVDEPEIATRPAKRANTQKEKRAEEDQRLIKFIDESLQQHKMKEESISLQKARAEMAMQTKEAFLSSIKELIDKQSDPISRKMILHYINIGYSPNSAKRAAILRAFQDLDIENNDRSTKLFENKFREFDNDLFKKVLHIKKKLKVIKDTGSLGKVKNEILKKIDEDLLQEKSILSNNESSSSKATKRKRVSKIEASKIKTLPRESKKRRIRKEKANEVAKRREEQQEESDSSDIDAYIISAEMEIDSTPNGDIDIEETSDLDENRVQLQFRTSATPFKKDL